MKTKKDNFFKRFIKFFKKILKNENTESIENNKKEDNIKNEFSYNKKTFLEEYKVEKQDTIQNNLSNDFKQKKLEEIIYIIEKYPYTLDKLDIDKLEIIDNYYIDKIAEYKKKIG